MASLYRGATNVVCEMSKADFSSYASLCFYKAVGEAISSGEYDDVIETVTDEAGDIAFVKTNHVKANLLMRFLSDKVYVDLSEHIAKGVTIHSGAFSGIRLLAAYGSEKQVKLLSVANVSCDMEGEYEQMGINQTRQRFYLVLRSEYTFIMPNYTSGAVVETKYLLYDYLIVGKVPSVYLGQN